MDYTKMVKDLVVGSREIDHMRAEVKTVVCTLTSQVDGSAFNGSARHSGSSQRGVWILQEYLSGKAQGRGVVEATFLLKEGRQQRAAYCSGNPDQLLMKDAQLVYDALPDFIRVMFTHYHELAERIQPLLNAAATAK